MRKLLLLSLLPLLLFACQKDCPVCEDCPDCPEDKYPSLQVMNEVTDSRSITAVKLVGYDFINLNISAGASQTFTLDKGMSGGYTDINVKVYFTHGTGSSSTTIIVDFSDGETTTIKLKGCISFEGCQGIYLEYNP